MKKRFISFLLATFCILTLMGSTLAVENRASSTVAHYTITATAGSGSGKILVSYDVSSNGTADSLGVSSIEIYKSDGTYVTTINGSTSNGLVRNNSIRHRSSYTYTGTSGTSYYAEVTVFAKIGSDYDSRTVTTAAVKAP